MLGIVRRRVQAKEGSLVRSSQEVVDRAVEEMPEVQRPKKIEVGFANHAKDRDTQRMCARGSQRKRWDGRLGLATKGARSAEEQIILKPIIQRRRDSRRCWR